MIALCSLRNNSRDPQKTEPNLPQIAPPGSPFGAMCVFRDAAQKLYKISGASAEFIAQKAICALGIAALLAVISSAYSLPACRTRVRSGAACDAPVPSIIGPALYWWQFGRRVGDRAHDR
jgi:hypothetical protein